MNTTTTATWRVVVGHHPIQSSGSNGDTVELGTIYALMTKYGVPLYINGHDHGARAPPALTENPRPPHDAPLDMRMRAAESAHRRTLLW